MFFRFVRLALLLLALAAAPRPLAAAQFLVSSNATDVFRSIGRASNGVVRLAGARLGEAGCFTANGTNFTFTPLAPLLNGGEAIAWRITRDGQYIVGSSDSPNTSIGFEPELRSRKRVALRQWMWA